MKLLDRLDVIARKFERFIAGSGPTDPLYISNRTLGQKIRLGVLIGTPAVAIGVLMVLALGNYFQTPPPPAETAAKAPTGEITRHVLPDLEKNYRSENESDCDVVEARISRTPERVLSGQLRNNSDRVVHVADIVFDITDATGSQLGAVSVRVEGIAPHAVASFRQVLEQQTAQNALVREVHAR